MNDDVRSPELTALRKECLRIVAEELSKTFPGVGFTVIIWPSGDISQPTYISNVPRPMCSKALHVMAEILAGNVYDNTQYKHGAINETDNN